MIVFYDLIFAIQVYVFHCTNRCYTLIYLVHIMGCVPDVGFMTNRHATVITHFVCYKNKK
jgi:hypothetical protein